MVAAVFLWSGGVLALPRLELRRQCPNAWFLLHQNGRCYLRLPASRPDLEPLRRALDAQSAYGQGLDPRAIDLGRYLFFDPLLSHDRSLSCAHCHHPAHALADGLPQAVGLGGHGAGPRRTGGEIVPRSTPTLWNTGLKSTWFWDGRATSLEDQARLPMIAANEMASTDAEVLARLTENATYKRFFAEVYGATAGSDLRPLTMAMVTHAIASFERTLISLNSRYDRYMSGDLGSLTGDELRGLNVFRSFVSRCPECHTPPLLSNGELAIIGVPDSGVVTDPGAATVLHDARLSGAFRVPTLRNIARTAPYMHAGAFADLQAVVEFYNLGGGRGARGTGNPRTHWHIRPMGLSSEELAALVGFLQTLTDESALPAVPDALPSGLPVLGES